MRPEDILLPTPSGVCCKLGGFHIDPTRPVERALITHAHSDHARAGHGAVLATRETLDLMRLRYGENFAGSTQIARYGENDRPRWRKSDVPSCRPCARLGADRGPSQRPAHRRLRRLQGRPGPDLPAVRAGAVRRFHHRGDIRPAGVSSWRSGRRDRKAAALGHAVSGARAPRRRLFARQGAAGHRADPQGRLHRADLSPRRDGEDHPLLRKPRHCARRTSPGAWRDQIEPCRHHHDLPAIGA